MGNSKGLKLVCRDGRWEWAAWELTRVHPEGGAEARYGMRTPCTLGDHWLALAADGSVASVQTVTLYDTAEQAEEVRAAWERQQEATIAG